jgi:hypothetical protein
VADEQGDWKPSAQNFSKPANSLQNASLCRLALILGGRFFGPAPSKLIG